MYQFVKGGAVVKRLADGAYIPFATDNSDFQAYQRYAADGGVTLAAPVDDPAVEAQRLLDALEQTTLMNRLMREFTLVSMQDMAQRQSEALATQGVEMSPQDILSQSVGWNKLVALNAQATALREQIA